MNDWLECEYVYCSLNYWWQHDPLYDYIVENVIEFLIKERGYKLRFVEGCADKVIFGLGHPKVSD
jgi:hypothetical protein